jgi:proline dehydrogenase
MPLRTSKAVARVGAPGFAERRTSSPAPTRAQVLKYLPYGPIREVLPYLVRRAQENNALLGNTASHLLVLQNELLRRWRGHAAAASG